MCTPAFILYFSNILREKSVFDTEHALFFVMLWNNQAGSLCHYLRLRLPLAFTLRNTLTHTEPEKMRGCVEVHQSYSFLFLLAPSKKAVRAQMMELIAKEGEWKRLIPLCSCLKCIAWVGAPTSALFSSCRTMFEMTTPWTQLVIFPLTHHHNYHCDCSDAVSFSLQVRAEASCSWPQAICRSIVGRRWQC